MKMRVEIEMERVMIDTGSATGVASDELLENKIANFMRKYSWIKNITVTKSGY